MTELGNVSFIAILLCKKQKKTLNDDIFLIFFHEVFLTNYDSDHLIYAYFINRKGMICTYYIQSSHDN